MNLNLSLEWLTLATLLAGLSIALFLRLRAARYPNTPAATLTFLAIIQPALTNGAGGLRAACFAAATFSTAAAAIALVRRQDPRRIVLLGGSLAGAQFVHPVWGTAATVILPFALRRSLTEDGAGRLAGWYVSLLFIPALAAMTLVYLSVAQNVEVAYWTVVAINSGHLTPTILCVATASMAVLPFLAFIWQRFVSEARVAAILCLIVVTTSAVMGALGHSQLLECAAAIGPLLIVMVGSWPDSAQRSFRAILFVGANFVLSWVLLFITQGHSYV